MASFPLEGSAGIPGFTRTVWSVSDRILFLRDRFHALPFG